MSAFRAFLSHFRRAGLAGISAGSRCAIALCCIVLLWAAVGWALAA